MSDSIYNSMVERKGKNKAFPLVIEAAAEPATAFDPRIEDDSSKEQAEDQHQPCDATVSAEVIIVDNTQEKM